MGFNISGIVINKKYLVKELPSIIMDRLLPNKPIKIEVEDVISNFTDSSFCDIYFGEQGTLILISPDLIMHDWAPYLNETLLFIKSEITMTFCFRYYINNSLKLERYEENGKTITDHHYSKNQSLNKNSEELLNQLIIKVLGEDLNTVDLSKSAYRFKLSEFSLPIHNLVDTQEVFIGNNSPSCLRLDLIPVPEKLKEICKSLSVLDAILDPSGGKRSFTFNSKWDTEEELFEFRDLEGDYLQILFKGKDILILGYQRNSLYKNWNNLYTYGESSRPISEIVTKEVPLIFSNQLNFNKENQIECTFCIWNIDNSGWITDFELLGTENYEDTSELIMHFLKSSPSEYVKTISDRIETKDGDLDKSAIQKLLNTQVLTKHILYSIDPEFRYIEYLLDDLSEIDFRHDLK